MPKIQTLKVESTITYDSPELTLPDFAHLNSYFMENILAYSNSAPQIAVNITVARTPS